MKIMIRGLALALPLLALALGLSGCADQTADVQECAARVTAAYRADGAPLTDDVAMRIEAKCRDAVEAGEWP